MDENILIDIDAEIKQSVEKEISILNKYMCGEFNYKSAAKQLGLSEKRFSTQYRQFIDLKNVESKNEDYTQKVEHLINSFYDTLIDYNTKKIVLNKYVNWEIDVSTTIKKLGISSSTFYNGEYADFIQRRKNKKNIVDNSNGLKIDNINEESDSSNDKIDIDLPIFDLEEKSSSLDNIDKLVTELEEVYAIVKECENILYNCDVTQAIECINQVYKENNNSKLKDCYHSLIDLKYNIDELKSKLNI